MQLSSIKELEQYITEKVNARWPEYNLKAVFKPIADLSHGDVGTDILIHLSNLTKRAPEALGVELWKEIDPSLPFLLERGFINFRGESHAQWLLREEARPALPEKAAFFVPLANQSVCFEGYVRLLSSCMLHVFESVRLGCESTVVLAQGEEIVASIATLPSIFIKTIAQWKPQNDVTFKPIDSFAGRFEKIYVWILTNQLNKKELGALLRHSLRTEGGLVVTIPEKGWGIAAPSEINDSWISKVTSSLETFIRFLYYFAGPSQFADLDFASVELDEQANPWWFLESTLDRLQSHGLSTLQPGTSQLESLTDIERHLLARLKYIDIFRAFAVKDGEFNEYITVLQDLLITFNKFFNQPHFRARIKAGQMNSTQEQIISGMSKSLRVLLSH